MILNQIKAFLIQLENLKNLPVEFSEEQILMCGCGIACQQIPSDSDTFRCQVKIFFFSFLNVGIKRQVAVSLGC